MGVVHKLKPKVEEFIVAKKRNEPEISCRKLTALIEKKFKLKISKSTVNSAMQKAGLSMPVGRRRKKRKFKTDSSNLSGAILLKAMDYLFGGTLSLVDTIKAKINSPLPDLLAQTEAQLYMPLFDNSPAAQMDTDYGLWHLIEHQFAPGELNSYLKQLQGVSGLNADIWAKLGKSLREVRCIKIEVGELNLYLDGQLHTLWTTENIPHVFATTIYNINSYINRYFQGNEPFVFFMPPGYEKPRKEFFEFISCLEGKGEELAKITLYGHKLEELGVVRMAEPKKKRYFAFGLWPWQFGTYRKVKSTGEFRTFTSEITREEFYIAEAEVELTQPHDKQVVTLKGCALKSRVWEKIRLLILSNLEGQEAAPEKLVNLYLSRWPNLEETFQDFSKKIELFTYSAGAKRFFSTESLNFDKPAPAGITEILKAYLEALDMHLRWHFLPPGYESRDFPTAKERFYSLPARIIKDKSSILVILKPPSTYPFLEDLEYLCRRINEREIILSGNSKLLLTIT